MTLAAALLAVVGLFAPSTALSSPPSNAFRFFHDADGRLKAAIDPEGDTALYNWDAAGNLLSISRNVSSKLAIVQLSPPRGEVGATVTIEGTGFSTTPASNTVKFNGTAASVSVASATSLTVKVPSGATSGSVTVTVGEEGPVTSPESFTVAESSAPKISSLSPTVAVAGEEVTISGSNFEPAVSSNAVTLNLSRPELVSASTTAIKFKVPTGTSGGRVSLSTPEGISATSPDLFIPPSGTPPSKVAATGRLASGEAKTITISMAEGIGVYLIDGTAGKRFSLTAQEGTFAGTVQILSPSGSSLGSENIVKTSKRLLEPVTLPTTGTYTIVVDPTGTETGSTKVTAYEFEDVNATVSPPASAEGVTKSASTTVPGQRVFYSMEAAAGKKVAVKSSNSAFTGEYRFEWLNPSGSQFAQSGWQQPTGSTLWGPISFTPAGTYKFLVDPWLWHTGSVDLTFHETPDITGQTISPSTEGDTKTSTIGIPGQRELITFSGTAGKRFSLTAQEGTFAGTVQILSPSGSSLGSENIVKTSKRLLEPVTLPTTGTYTIVVDPTGTETGSTKVTAYEFEDVNATVSPPASAEGVTKSASTTVPGQRVFYSMEAAAGKKVAVKSSNSAFTGEYRFEWLNPSGSQFAQSGWQQPTGSTLWGPISFTPAGTYKFLVDPWLWHTGSVDLTFHETPDITGQTISPSTEGDTKTSTIGIPGQRELITFSGTAGKRFSLTAQEGTFAGTVQILSPSGSSLGSENIVKTSKRLLEPVTLPTTGTYTIVVDPTGTETGSTKVTAYEFEDVNATVSPPASAEGVTKSASTTVPGQRVFYSMEAAAGKKVAVKSSNSAFTGEYRFEWLNPSGSQFAQSGWQQPTGSTLWGPISFTPAGTYKFLVDPWLWHTGSVDLTFHETPDITGQTISPSTEGDTKTSTIGIPGQRELITFSGTAGKRFSLTAQEGTFAGTVQILSPSGSSLGSENIVKTSKRLLEPVTLPTTGTYTIVVDPTGTETGSTKVTAYEFEDVNATVSPPASAEGVTKSASTTVPGQRVFYSMEAAAGKKVAVKSSNSAFTGEYRFEWLNPSGSQFAQSGWQQPTGSTLWGPISFTPAGTYKFLVDPWLWHTGSVDLTFHETPDITGQTISPSTEGDTKTSTIGIPGQRELITFSGTSGQTITTKATESTIAGGTMSILKPDGSQLGSAASFSTSSSGRIEVTLPTTGTYTVVLDPSDANTGSVKLTAYLGSHASWFSPIQPQAQFVSLTARLPQEPQGFSDISGPLHKPETGHSPEQGHSSPRTPHRTSLLHRKMRASHRRRHSSSPRARDHRSAHHRTRPKSGRGESRRSPNPGPSGITHEMRAFHPAAVKVWHPPRHIPGWEAAEPKSPWAAISALQAPAATTALAGQALERNGLPLAGVRVSVEGTTTDATTDEAGRFLLAGLPAGHQTLVVDGESVPGDRRYGSYEVSVDLANHETTVLDYTIWLTPLDPAGDRQITSSTEHETSLTTPSIPGLEVRIPTGTVIRNAAGKAVRDLNITAIPVNQAAFPLPPFVPIPVYFTIQPGRAYLSKGAQIVYPNWGDLRPGQRAEFWNYDPNDRGWYVYGRGTVSADGTQVVPDPGVRVWQFTGAMLASSPVPPGSGPTGTSSGDPVDLYSGLFTYHKRDLALPDTLPIDIQRIYRPADSNSYSFGIGTTNQYDLRLWSGSGAAEANLIMPDGQRIHYVRTTPGTGYSDAEYKSTSTPGPFYASTLKYNPAGGGAYWNLQLTNGMTYVFGVGRLLEVRDSHGNKLVITRSGEDMTQITSPHGRWVKFTYDGSHRITELTDNGGRHVKYTYTSGRLTKVEGLGGRTTEYEYDGSGRMKAIVNARGNKYLQVAYDANGRVEKQTTADEATFGFSYKLSEAGKVEATTVTDPLGRQRKVQFNSAGFPTSETEATGTELAQTTSFERQPETNLVLSETDPLGRETDFEYDSNGNVKEATRLAGTGEAQTTKYAYEPETNRLIEETDPLGHVTKYQYGSKGELLKRTDPLGHATTFEYNGDGQPTAITNAEGETTKLGYQFGDLASVTNPLGYMTSQFIDAVGRVRSITLPGGGRYRYGYNEADELTSVATPSGAETAIEYDADGNPISLTDPRGGETTMAYDVMDRLESETDPLERAAEWSYDKDGSLKEAVDHRGNVTKLAYDPLRRLASVSYGVSGETAESTIGYEYDEANRLTDVNDSASGEYAISFDNHDRLTGVEGPSGTVGYEYDAAGRRELMTVSGLGTVGYEYDDANRLTEVASGEQAVSLSYDKANRLESLALPDGIEQRYGYDKAGEVISIAYEQGESTLGEIDYAYDANGRTEAVWGSYARLGLPEAMESAKYNAANELTEREGKELEYDEDGNLTSDGSSEYNWDARGQLTGISGANSASFGYDPFGRRVSKTLGGTTTDLLYDGPNVVQEAVEGSVTADLLTGLKPDQLFSRTTEGGTDSYLTDRLGSAIALANSSGEVATTYTYDPFGSSTEGGETSDNPFQFTGRENDGTDLQYNRARYYSPSFGRFISRDPAGFEGSGANLYWYVNDNPLDFTDPSGECVVCIPSFNPIAPLEDAADQIGDWVSDAPGVLSDVGDFFGRNWDTIAAGTATLIVGAATVTLVVACVGATGGLAALHCGEAAAPGYAAFIGGVWVTYETTRN